MSELRESHRNISLVSATGIGVGAIVGGGILALGGVALAHAGPATIIAYILNAGIAFLTALSFAEMSSSFPENGGAYTFSKKVLSVRSAFSMGWILWFASIAAGVLYALGFAVYATSALETLMPNAQWVSWRSTQLSLAVIPLIFYTWMLTTKSEGSGKVETIGKLVIFTLIILGGIYLIGTNEELSIATAIQPFSPGGASGILIAMGFTFITLQGFDIISSVGGEVKNPRKNIPKAIFISLGIALAIYIPLLIVICLVGVPGEYASITEFAKKYPETVIAESVRFMFGSVGYWLIIIAAILSMLSALFANMLAASRISFSMASDRTLPRDLSKKNKNQKPVRAIWAGSLLIFIMLLIVPDLASAGAAASLIFLLSFTLTHITCMLARKRSGTKHEDSFRMPFFPLLPIIGMISCAALALFQGLSVPTAGMIAGLWLVLGFIFYFTTLADRAGVIDARYLAEDPNLIKLRGNSPLVLVPLANPANAQSMIEVAHALTPHKIGKVLLLSIIRNIEDLETTDRVPAQDVLMLSLKAALQKDIKPEAMVSVADEIWQEIKRIAHVHQCESLLLGIGDLDITEIEPMDRLINEVQSDVVLVKAPFGWHLGDSQKVLVTVSGHGENDILRARLLASICSTNTHEITYIRVVPEKTTLKKYDKYVEELMYSAEDESPIKAHLKVIKSDSPLEVIKSEAQKSDVVILGINRVADRKAISPFAAEIAKVTKGATIIISRNDKGKL